MQTEQKQQDIAQPTPPRRWIRYRGTYVVMAVTFIVLLLANYVGRIEFIINAPDLGDIFFDPGLREECRHGWPWTCLKRERTRFDSSTLSVLSNSINSWQHWDLFPWQGITNVSSVGIAGDIGIALALIALAGIAYEYRRRQRSRLLQFTFGDLLALLTMAAVFAGYHAAHYHADARELAALQRIHLVGLGEEVDLRSHQFVGMCGMSSASIQWRRGGPTWFRQFLGDKPFSIFDRVASLTLPEEKCEHLPAFQQLQVVTIPGGQIREPTGSILEQLPNLEVVIVQAGAWDPAAPKLPRVRYLVLSLCECHRRGLINLPALESLDLAHATLHGDVLGALQGSPRLQALSLQSTKLDDESFARLPDLAELRELDLRGNDITDHSLPRLKHRTSLRLLWLDDYQISPCGLIELRQALPHCEIRVDHIPLFPAPPPCDRTTSRGASLAPFPTLPATDTIQSTRQDEQASNHNKIIDDIDNK